MGPSERDNEPPFASRSYRVHCHTVVENAQVARSGLSAGAHLRRSLGLASDQFLDGDWRPDDTRVRRASRAYRRIDWPSIRASWTMPQHMGGGLRQNAGSVPMPDVTLPVQGSGIVAVTRPPEKLRSEAAGTNRRVARPPEGCNGSPPAFCLKLWRILVENRLSAGRSGRI
jgi:hypothetical protein